MNKENLRAHLYYEFTQVFNTLTLADIKDWNRIIELLINIVLDTCRRQEEIENFKK